MSLAARSAACIALAIAGRAAAAQTSPAPTGAFVVRLGTDTIAVERFARSGNAYSIEQVTRSPRTSLRHTHLELTPAGEVAQIFLMYHPIGGRPDAPLLASTKLTASGGDSASVEIKRGDSVQTRRATVRSGMIPSLAQSFLAYELAASRLRRGNIDSTSVTLLSPSGDTTPVIARRLGADSMTFTLPFLTYRARVDREGRILSLYQPLGTSVTRVPQIDVNGLASAWAKLDSAGKAMGPLSPLDSVTSTVGEARVKVVYSRPKKRGRTTFGSIVPWDSVWRTGANAATVLTTDRDLDIGGTRVSAGSYTLFTINSRGGSKLIISKETTRDGEPLAGTDYDPRHDLARIDMAVKTLATPVEPLTIEVIPGTAGAGTLRIVWDRREMTVPVRAK